MGFFTYELIVNIIFEGKGISNFKKNITNSKKKKLFLQNKIK
jgi:hypothetical protein